MRMGLNLCLFFFGVYVKKHLTLESDFRQISPILVRSHFEPEQPWDGWPMVHAEDRPAAADKPYDRTETLNRDIDNNSIEMC